MKIPKTLKIGGKKIKMRVIKKIDTDENENIIGLWDVEKYIITLQNNDTTPNGKLEECFLHEILEAINGLYELKLPHYKITLISELLYQIIKDNKLDFN